MSDSGLASQVREMEVGPVCAATFCGGDGGAVVSGAVRSGV